MALGVGAWDVALGSGSQALALSAGTQALALGARRAAPGHVGIVSTSVVKAQSYHAHLRKPAKAMGTDRTVISFKLENFIF